MDPIGDALIRIKNGYMVGRQVVSVKYSKLVLSILKLLEKEGYLGKATKDGNAIEVSLKYEDRIPSLTQVKRVSKPSLRVYKGTHDLPKVMGGIGIAIISTPLGVMKDADARKQNVGGGGIGARLVAFNMSRIGNSPVTIPQGVTVEKTGRDFSVTGPKGTLKMNIHELVSLEVGTDRILVKRKNEQKKVKALHGLTRSLIANMIDGVLTGFSKNLQLVGVGFRGQTDGSKLTLNVGFSHPIEILAPDGIKFEVNDNTNIKVLGIDKQVVGQTAANIRKIKAPDVYKGKGIRYEGEYIRKKIGKAAKAGAMGAGGAK